VDLIGAWNGERVLWTGSPSSTRPFLPADAVLIPLTVLWASFAVFWETAAARPGAPGFFMLWGVPFIVIGAYITVGRFFVRARRLASTTYAVTDQRVIEQVSWPRTRTRTSYLSQLDPPVVAVGKDGSTGSLAFGAMPTMMESIGEAGLPGRYGSGPPPIVLRSIENVRIVRDIIVAAQHT
jgi:hypothetical protein